MVVRHADSLNQHTSGKEAAAASFPSKRAARGRDMGKQKREQKVRDADSQTAEQLSPSLLTCFVLLAMLAAALAYHLLMWPAAGGTNSGGGVPGPPTQLPDIGDRVADRWAPQYPNGTRLCLEQADVTQVLGAWYAGPHGGVCPSLVDTTGCEDEVRPLRPQARPRRCMTTPHA